MPEDNQPDFKQWAFTGILVPFLCILFLVFFVAPALWGTELARKLGESLGKMFAVYLLCLSGASIVWKAAHKKRDRDSDRQAGDGVRRLARGEDRKDD